MKIIVTGSLGHISKPLTEELLQKGHDIVVISSNPEKQNEIEALRATAAIGSVEDAAFLTTIFSGADAVYTMVPPGNYFDKSFDPMTYCTRIGKSFAQAIEKSGVKRVVHLSSIGAHMDKDSGLILGHRAVEVILDKLSSVDITFLRPVGFYYNLFGFVPVIKNTGMIAANYGADDILIWVSPVDIAAAAAEELQGPAVRSKIRYVASDELTGNDTASILGESIGKPGLKWILIPGEQWQSGLQAAGMNSKAAAGLVEMFESQHNGSLMEDYYRNRPAVLGNVKMKDFAAEFAAVFKQ